MLPVLKERREKKSGQRSRQLLNIHPSRVVPGEFSPASGTDFPWFEVRTNPGIHSWRLPQLLEQQGGI